MPTGGRDVVVFKDGDFITGGCRTFVEEKDRVLVTGAERAIGGNKDRTSCSSSNIDLSARAAGTAPY
jgi:hypothetical protein